MADSSKTPKKGKPTLPAKPYVDFPLFPHATGRWAKKIRGKLRFYGRWGSSVAGTVVAVEDVEASAAAAKLEFDRCWPHHSQGNEVPASAAESGDGQYTIQDMVNDYLNFKYSRLETKEISLQTMDDAVRTCEIIVDYFGKGRAVESIVSADFKKLRTALADGCNLTTLWNKVNRIRGVFKFAIVTRKIPKAVDYGNEFDRPSAKNLRAVKNAAGPNMFSREELLMILSALDGQSIEVGESKFSCPRSAPMKAMVLLGLNAGFGNTDVASLPKSVVNLKTGWVEFPRSKTAIKRCVPLWPETVQALTAAIACRPDPANPNDADLCFLTERGTRFVRVQASKTDERRFVVINSLSRRFEQLLTSLDIGQRKGIGFYTLRHVFETIAGGCCDEVAVDLIMGHVDPSMAAQYREGFEDERLLDAVNYVRHWLWPETAKKRSKKAAVKAR